ncbi:hit family protein [Micrococcus lylae]|uniref:Hit family protein n=1 Tax=Micrococcus lylae TaxID=1273 RepID=A0A1R4IED8_9MICC|nr:hit family protein [Micrococcus lylae]
MIRPHHDAPDAGRQSPTGAADAPAAGHGLPDDGRATDQHTLAGVPDAFSRLWNAHRMAYVSKGQEQVKDEHTCPFCAGPSRSDEDSLILHRGETCFVLLNLYPYNPGHLLICPYRHVPLYTDITAEEAAEMARLTQTAMVALEKVANPAGYNLGMNQGAVGGAGIAAHLHQHVVPRWSGDGNFLPIIAQTKNMAQTLGQTWELLHTAWDEAAAEFAERQDGDAC